MNARAEIGRPLNRARRICCAPFTGRLFCVPSMFDSLGVQVPYPT